MHCIYIVHQYIYKCISIVYICTSQRTYAGLQVQVGPCLHKQVDNICYTLVTSYTDRCLSILYKNRVRQIQLDQNTFIGKIYIHSHTYYIYISYTYTQTLVCSYPLHSHSHSYSHSHLLGYTTATATDSMQTYSTDNNYTHTLTSSLVPYY